MIVVITPELAPAIIRKKYTGTGTQIINDGSKGGSWVVTDDFLSSAVKTKVKPFLGNSNEIRYVFGSKVVTMKIGASEKLDVTVK